MGGRWFGTHPKEPTQSSQWGRKVETVENKHCGNLHEGRWMVLDFNYLHKWV